MKRIYWATPFLLLWLSPAQATTILEVLTDADGKYTGPSLEDNVKTMDTDHNGFADIFEVRAYLEKLHGKGYEKAVFDRLEISATSKSCGTGFSKPLTEKNEHLSEVP